ncbi:F0F1-type ATP synthase, gamma subunit [Handroanthus impetiginosus]|uniref:ATP synthase subunit gamma n=1 Tax=Handroanthus impetiginosus TaxID=429701 RepID=A0A2G9H2I0_9LAMI|nr:F0F1-type ATP synthase, gamma subunit [Handroanthus impetiginosus]
MAMAALRRGGRRMAAPLISPHPVNSLSSSLASSEVLNSVSLVQAVQFNYCASEVDRSQNMGYPPAVSVLVFLLNSYANATNASMTKLILSIKKVINFYGYTRYVYLAILSVDVKKNVIVAISSDKGLCGGINSTAVKISRGLHKLNSGPEKECKYVILGEKAKVQLVRDSKKEIELSITELQKNPLNYTQVAVLADDILKNVEFDALRIVFNKFHSVVSFVPTTSTVLSPEVVEREAEAGGKLGELDSYEIEGGETKSEVLQNLSEFQFSCVLFNAVLENACSEQGARMSAMDSSSRNAGDMLDRLTLTYNRTRQASITTELIEIISGASALEG